MFADSTPSVQRRIKQGRSAVTNGKRLVLGAPRSGQHARRFRDLVELYSAEVGVTLSTSDTAMVRLAAALTVRAEMMQTELSNGVAVDADDMIRISSEARRVVDALKTRAARKPAATPSLQDYLANRAGDAA